MKKALLVLGMVALTLGMNAQSLRVNETDEFTGSVKKFTNFYKLAKTEVGTLSSSVMRIDNYTFLQVSSSVDLGCSGAVGNKIIFLFSDGTKTELEDIADINCKDSASSLFNITNLDFSNLTKVRFKQSEYYTDGVVYGSFTLQQQINVTK